MFKTYSYFCRVKAITGRDIPVAAELLKQGKCVAIPTETVYGLAANALDLQAVLSIFRIKDRPDFDPLIVHVGSIDAAKKYVRDFPGKAEILAKTFWPGPLTIVLPKNELISSAVTSGLTTVGIRVPDHPLTLELLDKLDFPLAAPSANPFGYISPTTAQHVSDQLGDKIEYILDGGPSKVGIESTIISFDGKVPKILRQGKITESMIADLIGEVEIAQSSSSRPEAPGMLDSHYSPQTPMIISGLRLPAQWKKTGSIRWQEYDRNLPEDMQELLSPDGDLFEAARTLYRAMRRMDQRELDGIVIELVPEVGIGKAINDRIRRAALYQQ